jgi:hypothetical protein
MTLSYEDAAVLLVAMFLQRGNMADVNTTPRETRFVASYFSLASLRPFQINMAFSLLQFYCIRYHKPFKNFDICKIEGKYRLPPFCVFTIHVYLCVCLCIYMYTHIYTYVA